VIAEYTGLIEREHQIIVDPLPLTLPRHQVVAVLVLPKAICEYAIALETAICRSQLFEYLSARDGSAFEEIDVGTPRRRRSGAAGECDHAERKTDPKLPAHIPPLLGPEFHGSVCARADLPATRAQSNARA